MATSTSATSSLFTGTSAFSSDFQSAITRAVQIASLPITQLQSDQTALTSRSTELGALNSKFSALQTAVQDIDTAVSGSSFNADISDPSIVSANVSDGAMEGNYSIKVDSVGAFATSLTSNSWVDTAGAPQTYQLMIGGVAHAVTASDNSAASVASAIDAQYGGQVQATVVNVGSSDSPDYRIALQNQQLGDSPVDLQLNGVSLQAQQTTGSLAQYEVNGSGITVQSNTRSITISNGVTVNLLSASSSPVNITVTRSSTALANALANFADAYNSAVDEVGSQRGQNAGPLQGDSIVFELSQSLGSIGTYSDESPFGGLASLGLSLGSDGHITFNEGTMLSADLTNSSAVNAFLGSTSGGGFLQTVNNTLNGLLDPTSGDLTTSQNAIQQQISHIGDEITSQQAAVTLLQTNLTNQMSAADALVATMEQQYSSLTAMFQAEQINTQEMSHA